MIPSPTITAPIVKTIRRWIGSPNRIRLKMAAKIGIEAKMSTTLATLVWVIAKTNPGAVEPTRSMYTQTGQPARKVGAKTFGPCVANRTNRMNRPDVKPRQNAVTIGSAWINRTNSESGTTNSTASEVISNPLR